MDTRSFIKEESESGRRNGCRVLSAAIKASIRFASRIIKLEIKNASALVRPDGRRSAFPCLLFRAWSNMDREATKDLSPIADYYLFTKSNARSSAPSVDRRSSDERDNTVKARLNTRPWLGSFSGEPPLSVA